MYFNVNYILLNDQFFRNILHNVGFVRKLPYYNQNYLCLNHSLIITVVSRDVPTLKGKQIIII